MASLRLLLDRITNPLWDKDERQTLLNVSHELMDLQWEQKPGAGGCGSGSAEIHLVRGTPAYQALVERGETSVAWIWWVRDPNESDAEDAETDLLWVGMVDDAETIDDTDIVRLKLRGAGAWLDELRFTGEYEYEKITTIAAAVLQSAIDAGDNPVKAKSVDTVGSLQRRVSITFDDVTLRRALEDLQSLAGGPAMVGFGVAPADDQDNYGTGYFLNWEGHLWTKTAIVDPRRVFSLTERQLVKLKRRSTAKDVRNAITVIGDEIPGSGEANETPEFYTGTAEAAESIARFGRREELIEERSLKSHGACALYASGVAAARSSLDRETEVTALINLQTEPTNGLLAENVISTALTRAGRFLTVRTPVDPYIAWGDGRTVLKNRRNTTDRQYARINLANAPTGANAPLYELDVSPTVGDKRLHICLGERPSFTAPSPEIFELNKAVAVRWDNTTGSNYRLQIIGLRASSGAWELIANSTITRTAAELANPHTVSLEIKYETASTWTFTAYHTDAANNAVQMCTLVGLAASWFHNSGNPLGVYLNAATSTALAAFTSGNGYSDDYDIGYFAALKEYDDTDVVGELDAIGLGEFPFRRYGDLVLMTNFAQTDPDADPDAGLVLALARYAYGQQGPASEFACELSANHDGYAEVDTALPSWRSYEWLMGERRSPRKMGQNAEVVPASAKMHYGGPGMPIEVTIRGLRGSQRATDFLLNTLEQLDRVSENARGTK